MPTIELIHARAAAMFADPEISSEAELVALYKKFLHVENHRLRLNHQAGAGGVALARQRALLVDIILRHLLVAAPRLLNSPAKESGLADNLAFVGVGGYGRGELSPFSDVDLLFLHEDGEDAQMGELLAGMIRILWDAGVKVSHSTRSVANAVDHANDDMFTKTALLEARFIAGKEKLYDQFKRGFFKKCIRGHEAEYIAQRRENQHERHAKSSFRITLQEPNVKSGCGSLRDYHNLLWVSIFTHHAGSTEALVTQGLLPEGDRRRLERAYDFLHRVRTALHYLNGREHDTLNLTYQLPVATYLGYAQKNPLTRIEVFMRDYYRHSRHLFRITENTVERLINPEPPSVHRSVLAFLQRKKKREAFDGFFIADGRLYARSRDIFKEDPLRLMRAFQHIQQRHLDFSPELRMLIRRSLPLVDREFLHARAARETFSAILSRKGEVGRILRLMHECDFLGKFIPEFAPLTCLVQHEFFHRYTADEHTLVCLEKLDALIDTEAPQLQGYKELFQKLETPYILHLAILLHDVGKASHAHDHADASAMAASQVAARLHLSSEERKMLLFLVDLHLQLSSTAQHRNIEDPATISEFAEIVHNQPNLDALMLLTLADGMGIGGEERWSDWKEALVWTLYQSTSRYLAEGAAFFEERARQRSVTQEAVLKRLNASFADEVEAHFALMPEGYFHAFVADDIAAHLKLFRAFFETLGLGAEPLTNATGSMPSFGLAPAILWTPHPDQGHSELWVCTWDRRQLLAKIAGALALAQLNILSADIYTRADDLVFDIFRVCDTRFQAVTPGRATRLFEATLRQALSETGFDFPVALKKAHRRRSELAQGLEFPTHIAIDNSAHPDYTLVDLQAPDRLGLLYHILRGFGEMELNIDLARIATEKGAALDSFYVTNAKGRKIKSPAGIARLQESLRKATSEQRGEGEAVNQAN